ncbi:beta-1,4-galactosyltransferase 4-like [Spodoptera frugiperda]|uniref:Beta-1,4-N-acetylgalactosaminyltransferase n=1 Tax=Spodoptera frugiperda TaxID=7108 RepID=A0A9R0DM74_SPOFR|nr:beta-1,4-galactosyltransferase 4-like [Spodoptera frugiperda]
MDTYPCCTTRRVGIFIVCLIIIIDCYFHLIVYYDILKNNARRRSYDVTKVLSAQNKSASRYKYSLVDSQDAFMDYENAFNSSYYWFMSMKTLFKNIAAEAPPAYTNDTPRCNLTGTSDTIGFKLLNATGPKFQQIEESPAIAAVKLGGYYAPAHCRAAHRVAVVILVPSSYCITNRLVLLHNLHALLQKQLLEYRIFVMPRFLGDPKGSLYNAAFLETQRFGTWDCLIFHDVDLIPEDERISYSCPEHPTQILSWGNRSIGIVTAMLPDQYQAVNGYSNMYVDSDLADFDFSGRLEAMNYTIVKHDDPVARFRIMANITNHLDDKRASLIAMNRLLLPKEGLSTTKYKMIRIDQDRLFTYILAFSVNDILLQYDPLKEK